MSKTSLQRQRKELQKQLDGWEPNSNHPPDYVRRDGLGKVVATVDVHLGGYQLATKPIAIGLSCCGPAHLQQAHHHEYDLLIVADHGDKETAINVAMAQADKALVKLGWPGALDGHARRGLIG